MTKTIVITGAGVGLGRALARRFASEGHAVALLGRTYAKVEAAAVEIGGSAIAVECDVSLPESVRAAFARIAEHHPKIDILINNAAIFQPFLIAEATDEQIVGGVSTNLIGPMLCVRSAIPMMGPGGHIINISSESVDLPYPHLITYQSSKAGLERFSHFLARELEPSNIRVTNVRAGQMNEEGKTWNVDRAAQMRFAEQAIANGLDLKQRPVSHINSVVDAFCALIALPPDVHAPTISFQGRAAV